MMKITHFKFINRGSMTCSFNASFDKWGDFEVRNIVLFESGGKKWISLPSREYEDTATGKKRYFPFVGFADKEKNERFKAQIMVQLENFMASMPKEAIIKTTGDGPSALDDNLPF